MSVSSFLVRACFFILSVTSPTLFCADTKGAFSSLEEEYTPKYCLQLEAAYGTGLMSEGGKEGIDSMFEGVPLQGKAALDIGSGIGGAAFYLADKYAMHITGLEVNPWMVEESKRRTPEDLKGKVDFFLSSGNSNWPILENSYDIIYSKGVLTHVEEKDELFLECHRLLKEDGLLVITDWLSSEEKGWGSNIAQLVELEHLTLFPESESGYVDLLTRNGFVVLSVRDESPAYLGYNLEIAEKLIDKQTCSDIFSLSELEASIMGYQSIAKALEVGELRVLRFIARKVN